MSRGAAFLLLLIALVRLGWHAGTPGIASGYVDPVSRIAAQDEAVYTHIAQNMGLHGDWITPHFMGRLALFKPPLLYWTSAASMRLFGDNALAYRLPSVVAGATIAALFAWCLPLPGSLIAALLLLSNPQWHTLSRLNLTDALLALWVTLACVGLWKQSRLLFACATAAAILTKGIAGFIPLVMLGLWWLVRRPPFWQWAWAGVAALLLAAPWFVYQWLAHTQWFYAEFIQVEILGYSVGAPPQTSTESHAWFYVRRLLWMDPVLLLLAATTLPAAWRARKTDPAVVPLVTTIAAVTLAVAGNQYRNVAYVLPAIPALCWLVGAFPPKRTRPLLVGLLAILAIRLAFPAQPWGLPFDRTSTVPAAPVLDAYKLLNRPNELMLIDAGDEFYAATLRLPRIRYGFTGSEDAYRRYGLDFRYLGVALNPQEYHQRRDLEPLFAQRLREWDVRSTEAVGSVIVAPDARAFAALIATEPHVDFLVPASMGPLLLSSSHERREVGSQLLLLLSEGSR